MSAYPARAGDDPHCDASQPRPARDSAEASAALRPRAGPEWGLIADRTSDRALITPQCIFPGLTDAASSGSRGSVTFRRARPGEHPGPAVLDYRSGRAVIHYSRKLEDAAAETLATIASRIADKVSGGQAADDVSGGQAILWRDRAVTLAPLPHGTYGVSHDFLHPVACWPALAADIILTICARVIDPGLAVEIGQLLTAHLDCLRQGSQVRP